MAKDSSPLAFALRPIAMEDLPVAAAALTPLLSSSVFMAIYFSNTVLADLGVPLTFLINA